MFLRWLKTTGSSTSSENLTDFPCSAFSGLGGGVLTRVSAGFADPLGPPLTPEAERPLPNFFESLDPISSRAGVDTPSAAAWLTRAYKNNKRQIHVRKVIFKIGLES